MLCNYIYFHNVRSSLCLYDHLIFWIQDILDSGLVIGQTSILAFGAYVSCQRTTVWSSLGKYCTAIPHLLHSEMDVI